MQMLNLHVLPAEMLSATWARTHGDQQFTFSSGEAHYLESLAMSLDDDLDSLLLLKKLRRAWIVERERLPADLVTTTSLVQYSFAGDDARLARIARPAAAGNHGSMLPADSRLGLGLLGLRAGQAIVWPDHNGFFRELHVQRVRNGGSSGEDDGTAPTPPAAA